MRCIAAAWKKSIKLKIDTGTRYNKIYRRHRQLFLYLDKYRRV